ncbi:hypothetical protein BDV10DRAFT_187960 [Aspergillus recurvatus]
MASPILFGAILIAVKFVDEHEKAKQRGESLSTDADTTTEPIISASASKKNIPSRTYWHERRKSRREPGETRGQVENMGLTSEAPPPYERMITLPMYRELERVEH